MKDIKIPGVFWTVVLIGAPLLAVWVQDSFPNAVWAVPVAGLMLIIAKIVQAVTEPEPKQPDTLEMMMDAAQPTYLPEPVEQPSKASTIIWG